MTQNLLTSHIRSVYRGSKMKHSKKRVMEAQ